MKAWLVLLGNSRLWRSLVTSLIVCLGFLLLTSTTYAEGIPITPSGLNTQVSDPIAVGGQTQYDITGGTRPGGVSGTNLFHSFGEFGVPPTNIANFLNGVSFDLNGNQLPAGLQTSNILARVTGTNGNNPTLSSIYGTIQTTGFENANLFLMNPAGFLFGPNATVNIGGMMTFTTANDMRLRELAGSNAGIFHADTAQTNILTSAPVAEFGFIGSNPRSIDFIGGQLTVARGTGLAFVGGNISLVPDSSGAPSTITTHGRPLQLSSVAGTSEGVVAADTGVPAEGMTLGTITLGQDTALSTTGDFSSGDGSGSGGSVSIRGGQFVATGATINTSPVEGSFGSGGSVTIDVTGSATFTDSMIQTNPVDFSFAGSAGATSILANDSLIMTNTTIDTSTEFALGDSGAVTLGTNGPLSVTDSTINTRSDLSGNGGAVTVTGMDVTMGRTRIITDVLSDPGLGQDVIRPGAVTVTAQDTVTISGLKTDDPIITAKATATLVDAGSVTITGKTVNLSNGRVDVGMANDFVISPGNGGAIEIRGNDVTLTQFQLISQADGLPESTGTGGSILLRGADSIHADNIQLTASQVNADATSGGGGGNIEFQSKLLTVSDHTDVTTGSFGQGSGGTIVVRGAEDVTIESGSRMLTSVVISLVGVPQGTAGNILIETQNLTLQGGGHIRAGTLPLSTGNAANITVQGTSSPAESVIIDGPGSGIFTDTEGTGAGGDIFVNADSVTLQNGGTLSAKTSGTAATATGGSITVTATDHVTMTSGASITASSTGPGDAGNILINAGQTFVATNSHDAVVTQADAASGGDITVLATDRVQLTNSRISASVADGPGGGGNISIDPQFVILQNSQILAQAAQGQGGAITITTNLFLPDTNSSVKADSSSGVNGTVTIQSPNAPASGQIQPLGKTPLIATTLLNQHCASLAGGEFSSFTVAGRDSLPTEPGGWLASPLATLNAGMGLGVKAEGERSVAQGEGEPPLLSLRQIAPAGFLTQAFAVDWSASCQS